MSEGSSVESDDDVPDSGVELVAGGVCVVSGVELAAGGVCVAAGAGAVAGGVDAAGDSTAASVSDISLGSSSEQAPSKLTEAAMETSTAYVRTFLIKHLITQVVSNHFLFLSRA